jgi:hypothetical protein
MRVRRPTLPRGGKKTPLVICRTSRRFMLLFQGCRGPEGARHVQAAYPGHHQTCRWPRHVPDCRTDAGIPAGLEVILLSGANPADIQKSGFMDTTPSRCHSTQALAYRDDCLQSLGAPHELAALMAGGAGHWWRHSEAGLNRILTVEYFDALGVPPTHMTFTSRTARRGPACRGGVAGAQP